jgi:hypothetical protein
MLVGTNHTKVLKIKKCTSKHLCDIQTELLIYLLSGCSYQPAQKWLKDRKGRKPEFDDILHYQKVIVVLTETGRTMKEIDKVGVE